MKIQLFATAAILLLLAPFSNAQKKAQLSRIDVYVRDLKVLTESKPKERTIVANTEYDQAKGSWQKFASEKALEKHRQVNETYSIAYNWKSNGKLVVSSFTEFSPSGDWTQFTSYFFRADGTVAKVEAELRTFYGNYVVNRDFYFNKKGQLLANGSKYFDLTTNKPKKPTKDMLEGNAEFLKSDFFKRVDKLPFAPLVGAK